MARANTTSTPRMTKADFAAHATEHTATKAQLAAACAQAKELKAKREAEEAAKVAAHAAAQAQPVAATLDELGLDDYEFDLPWKRVAIGFVLGVASAGAVGYGIGMIAAYCIAGIMTLTTSAGIALFLSFTVWLLAIYASWKIGGWVGGKVFASVVLPDGLASRSAESISDAARGAKNTVASWFGASKEKAKAQFTGAHTKVAAA